MYCKIDILCFFIQKSLTRAELKAMGSAVADNGMTPLLEACNCYKMWNVSNRKLHKSHEGLSSYLEVEHFLWLFVFYD